MPHYVKMGNIPHKRHTQFRQENGELYYEQLMGTKGFSGIQSLIYHINPPTRVKEAKKLKDIQYEFEEKDALKHRHFLTWNTEPGGGFLEARKILLANDDLAIGVARPSQPMSYFYRNGECDEMLYVHEGTGKIESIFGELSFYPGDYVIIPMGTTYRVVLETNEARFLVIESNSAIVPPKRYRNEHGQLLEHSPYCERDFRTPERLEPKDEKGEFEAHNYVICSFVPRLYDYHPEAVPAPYVHSNVESDEVLYYADGDFMSRRGIEEGSITLHPSGLPHGPHPGKMEESIGKKDTKELAVMIDTFRPLRVVKEAHHYEDASYMNSWFEK